MAVNWDAVAAEVDAALKSVASSDAGYPIALRKVTSSGDAWNPTLMPSYSQLYGIVDNQRLRDAAGTLIGVTLETLIVSATGTAPAKGDKVAAGVLATDAEADDDGTTWREIAEVRELAPAGTAVLYEIDLVS